MKHKTIHGEKHRVRKTIYKKTKVKAKFKSYSEHKGSTESIRSAVPSHS